MNDPTLTAIADTVGLGLICIAAIMCLSSAIGLLRLPDLYSRMHAASKPQALGMLLMLLGLFLRLRSWQVLDTVILVAAFQLVTIPVSAHLLSRAQYRIGERPPERSVPRPQEERRDR